MSLKVCCVLSRSISTVAQFDFRVISPWRSCGDDSSCLWDSSNFQVRWGRKKSSTGGAALQENWSSNFKIWLLKPASHWSHSDEELGQSVKTSHLLSCSIITPEVIGDVSLCWPLSLSVLLALRNKGQKHRQTDKLHMYFNNQARGFFSVSASTVALLPQGRKVDSSFNLSEFACCPTVFSPIKLTFFNRPG